MYHTSNNYSSLSNDFSLLIHQTGEVLLVIAFMKWSLYEYIEMSSLITEDHPLTHTANWVVDSGSWTK